MIPPPASPTKTDSAKTSRRRSGSSAATLQEEKFTKAKFFAGVNVNLGVNFAFEYDNTGSISTYSAKVGFRF